MTSPEPTLTFDELFARRPATLSACCRGSVDADGRCETCELPAGILTAHVCGTCKTHVTETAGETGPILECGTCGARWDDLTRPTTEDLTGLVATSWSPLLLPDVHARFLSAYDQRLAA